MRRKSDQTWINNKVVDEREEGVLPLQLSKTWNPKQPAASRDEYVRELSHDVYPKTQYRARRRGKVFVNDNTDFEPGTAAVPRNKSRFDEDLEYDLERREISRGEHIMSKKLAQDVEPLRETDASEEVPESALADAEALEDLTDVPEIGGDVELDPVPEALPELVDDEVARAVLKALDVKEGDVDLAEFKTGIVLEFKEHGIGAAGADVIGDSLVAAGKIALAHLQEQKDYYTKLKQMESKGGDMGNDMAVTMDDVMAEPAGAPVKVKTSGEKKVAELAEGDTVTIMDSDELPSYLNQVRGKSGEVTDVSPEWIGIWFASEKALLNSPPKYVLKAAAKIAAAADDKAIRDSVESVIVEYAPYSKHLDSVDLMDVTRAEYDEILEEYDAAVEGSEFEEDGGGSAGIKMWFKDGDVIEFETNSAELEDFKLSENAGLETDQGIAFVDYWDAMDRTKRDAWLIALIEEVAGQKLFGGKPKQARRTAGDVKTPYMMNMPPSCAEEHRLFHKGWWVRLSDPKDTYVYGKTGQILQILDDGMLRIDLRNGTAVDRPPEALERLYGSGSIGSGRLKSYRGRERDKKDWGMGVGDTTIPTRFETGMPGSGEIGKAGSRRRASVARVNRGFILSPKIVPAADNDFDYPLVVSKGMEIFLNYTDNPINMNHAVYITLDNAIMDVIEEALRRYWDGLEDVPAEALRSFGNTRRAKVSDEAQAYISKKIKKLVGEEGYDQDQAAAIAYQYARDKGYDVPEKKK